MKNIKLDLKKLKTNLLSDEIQIELVNSINDKNVIRKMDYRAKAKNYIFSFEGKDFFQSGDNIIDDGGKVIASNASPMVMSDGEILIRKSNGDSFRLKSELDIYRGVYTVSKQDEYFNGHLNIIMNNITIPLMSVFDEKTKTGYAVQNWRESSQDYWSLGKINIDGTIDEIYQEAKTITTTTRFRIGRQIIQIGEHRYIILYRTVSPNGRAKNTFFKIKESGSPEIINPDNIISGFDNYIGGDGKNYSHFWVSSEDENYYYAFCYTSFGTTPGGYRIRTDKSTFAVQVDQLTTLPFNIWEVSEKYVISNEEKLYRRDLSNIFGFDNATPIEKDTSYNFRWGMIEIGKNKFIGINNALKTAQVYIIQENIIKRQGDEIIIQSGDEIPFTKKTIKTISLENLKANMIASVGIPNSHASNDGKKMKQDKNKVNYIISDDGGYITSNLYLGNFGKFQIYGSGENDFGLRGVYSFDSNKKLLDSIFFEEKEKINAIENLTSYYNLKIYTEASHPSIIQVNNILNIREHYFIMPNKVKTLENVNQFLLIILENGDKYALYGYDKSTFLLQKLPQNDFGNLIDGVNYFEVLGNNLRFAYNEKLETISFPSLEKITNAKKHKGNIIIETDSGKVYIFNPVFQSFCLFKIDGDEIEGIDELYIEAENFRYFLTNAEAENQEFSIKFKIAEAKRGWVRRVYSLAAIEKIIQNETETEGRQIRDMWEVSGNFRNGIEFEIFFKEGIKDGIFLEGF
jgi:hypothetical protein